jgi:hypothetical protein
MVICATRANGPPREKVWPSVGKSSGIVRLSRPFRAPEWVGVGYLGHRRAQPQAVLSVPVGDARVQWRHAWSERSGLLWSLGTHGFGERRAKRSGHLSESVVFVVGFDLSQTVWSFVVPLEARGVGREKVWSFVVPEGQRPGTIPAWANGPGFRIESFQKG